MSEGKDLTKGNLLSNMVKFCIPLLITNLLNSVYNIVDGIWIGRLVGDDGLAATTNCWPIMLTASSVLTGVTVTMSVLVAQHFASKEKEKIKEIVTPLYIISFIMGIITTTILILAENFLFNLFNTPLEIIDQAKEYATVYLIGFIFDFVAFTIIDAIRATGNSKVPLAILAATEFTNIILDPILIKLGFGVKGAAMATAISMLFCLILSYLYIRKSELLRFNRKNIKFEKEFLKQISILGIPMIVQQVATIFTIMLEVNIANSLGVIGGSTYGIVSKLQEFVWVLGNALNELLTVVVGQFIGKRAFHRIKDVMKNGMMLTTIPMIVIATFIIFFSEQFARIFTNSEEVIATAIGYMHFIGIGFSIAPLCQFLNGFVLGIGNTRYTFITAIIASAVEIITILSLRNYIDNPFTCLGIGISWWYAIEIIMFAIYYFSKCWWKKEDMVVEEG